MRRARVTARRHTTAPGWGQELRFILALYERGTFLRFHESPVPVTEPEGLSHLLSQRLLLRQRHPFIDPLKEPVSLHPLVEKQFVEGAFGYRVIDRARVLQYGLLVPGIESAETLIEEVRKELYRSLVRMRKQAQVGKPFWTALMSSSQGAHQTTPPFSASLPRPLLHLLKELAQRKSSVGKTLDVAWLYGWVKMAGDNLVTAMQFYYDYIAREKPMRHKEAHLRGRAKLLLRELEQLLSPEVRTEAKAAVGKDIEWLFNSLNQVVVDSVALHKIRCNFGIQRKRSTPQHKQLFWRNILGRIVLDLRPFFQGYKLIELTSEKPYAVPDETFEIVARLFRHSWPTIWGDVPQLAQSLRRRFHYYKLDLPAKGLPS